MHVVTKGWDKQKRTKNSQPARSSAGDDGDGKKESEKKCFGMAGKIQCTTAKQFLSVWPHRKRYAVHNTCRKYAVEY